MTEALLWLAYAAIWGVVAVFCCARTKYCTHPDDPTVMFLLLSAAMTVAGVLLSLLHLAKYLLK